MIGKDELAAIVRRNDEMVGSIDGWLGGMGIEGPAFRHVSGQRALRAARLLIDRRPVPQAGESPLILLSEQAKAMLIPLQATWIDGFVAGVEAEKLRRGEPPAPEGTRAERNARAIELLRKWREEDDEENWEILKEILELEEDDER